MDMDYKPNSHKYKTEQQEVETRKVEKVAKGKVRARKNDGIRRFADVFISEDVANVKSYVFMDVLVPAIKKAVCDIITDGVNMIFYGDTGHAKSRSSSSKVSYRSYYDERRDDDRRYNSSRTRKGFDYDEIVFSSKGEAEAILTQMDELIGRYGFVTVFDLYDMAELTAPYTANKYGWTNINSADSIRVRDGYILRLPKALPID